MKRKPSRRRYIPASPSDKIMLDRDRFWRENKACAGIIIAHPEKAGGCVGLIDWALNFVDLPLETE